MFEYTFERNGKKYSCMEYDIVGELRGVPISRGPILTPFFFDSCAIREVPMKTIGDFLNFVESLTEVEKESHVGMIFMSCFRDQFVSMRHVRNLDPTTLLETEDTIRGGLSSSYNFVLLDSEVLEVIRVAPSWAVPAQWFQEDEGITVPGVSRDYCRVMNYTFTPELNFMSTPRDKGSLLYFGLELEVSTKLSAAELQSIVTQVEPKQEVFFYMKSDNSIGGKYDHLYEIVTHPMTPRRQRKEWKTLFKKLEDLGAKKGLLLSDFFDTSKTLTNGIHIHLSRDAFLQSYSGRETHMNRFVSSWNLWDSQSQEFFQKISKRQLQPKDMHYCGIHPQLDGLRVARQLHRGTSVCSDNHYSACHVTRRTVELRIFQGIVNLDHILSCIDLAEATFDFTRDALAISHIGWRFSSVFTDWLMKQPRFTKAKEAIKCA